VFQATIHPPKGWAASRGAESKAESDAAAAPSTRAGADQASPLLVERLTAMSPSAAPGRPAVAQAAIHVPRPSEARSQLVSAPESKAALVLTGKGALQEAPLSVERQPIRS